MSRSFENRERRRGVWAFIGVYLAFMVTVIALQVARSHDLGYGLY